MERFRGKPGRGDARSLVTRALLLAVIACGLGAFTASAQAKVLSLRDLSGVLGEEVPVTLSMPAEYLEFTAPQLSFTCESSFSLYGEALVNNSATDQFVINEVSGPLTSLESCPNLVTASGLRWGLKLTAGRKVSLSGSPDILLSIAGCPFASKLMKGTATYLPQLIFSLTGTFTSNSPGCLKKAVIRIGIFEGYANGPIEGFIK